ncbi:hypothetical protein [Streptomyces murinus]|uniref:hypothetical protein n=1 Tax=Streptomyces murinus TaxID=33900 RepID=UPI002113C14B|nr:hypothetical protein [Streptomyces murinus]
MTSEETTVAELDERAWADAIGMYERRYTYAKVTGRDHADWALDVDRLMRGDTPDVRGWRVNDPLAGEFERLDDPYYPFALPSDSSWPSPRCGSMWRTPRNSKNAGRTWSGGRK